MPHYYVHKKARQHFLLVAITAGASSKFGSLILRTLCPFDGVVLHKLLFNASEGRRT